jgi:hypothetical protein
MNAVSEKVSNSIQPSLPSSLESLETTVIQDTKKEVIVNPMNEETADTTTTTTTTQDNTSL